MFKKNESADRYAGWCNHVEWETNIKYTVTLNLADLGSL